MDSLSTVFCICLDDKGQLVKNSSYPVAMLELPPIACPCPAS